MLTFSQDKDRLQSHFEKDPYLFGYHLGDLDDFYFPYCQWMVAYLERAHIQEAVLVYTGLSVPSVVAFGIGDLSDDLMRETVSLLPDRFFGHYQMRSRETLHSLYIEKPLGHFHKMALRSFKRGKNDDDSRIVRLDQSHEAQLRALYEEAYPENYFTPKMLQTGKYFGWLEDDRILSVAGVHVYSQRYNIAVLGNIATDPSARGRGLATAVTSHLVHELVDEGLRVGLNVREDNSAAISCYRSLGFEKVHEYEEGLFELKE